MKNIKELSEILNIKNQKKEFDLLVDSFILFIKKETDLIIKKEEICIKNNIIKIKTNSNKKFVLFINNVFNNKFLFSNNEYIIE